MATIKSQYDPEENARDDARAAARFRGQGYHDVLALLHWALRPSVYLEIGVERGGSLALAQPPTEAIGVDPVAVTRRRWRARTYLAQMTSDEFFESNSASFVLGRRKVGLAFLDGRHRFEQTARDFVHAVPRMELRGVIAIHDTVPLDERTSGRERRAEFHTGDVWKMLPWLARGGWEYVTVPCAPSGLTLVRLGDGGTAVDPAEAEALDWEWWECEGVGVARAIENERGAILQWLFRQ